MNRTLIFLLGGLLGTLAQAGLPATAVAPGSGRSGIELTSLDDNCPQIDMAGIESGIYTNASPKELPWEESMDFWLHATLECQQSSTHYVYYLDVAFLAALGPGPAAAGRAAA